MKDLYWNTYGSNTLLRDYLYLNFYDWYKSEPPPSWFRRKINKKRRYSNRNTLFLIKNGVIDWDNAVFDDNYRDVNWLFW